MTSPSTTIAPSTAHMRAEWTLDSRPICSAVEAAIGPRESKPIGLLPPLVEVIVSYLKVNNGSIFGAREWETLCGKVGPVPALPLNIENIWQSACSAFPGKNVHETHMLVYIPATVDKKPLTLRSLGEIAMRYFPANAGGYGYICDSMVALQGNRPIERSYWVLMTKDVLSESRNKSYADQQAMVTELATKALAAYEVPGTLEAAACILVQYFSSHADSKTRLFSNSPTTYTRCQEKIERYHLVVGGFAPAGLNVFDDFDNNDIGVAVLRKF